MRELTCDLIVADHPTLNGRIYSEQSLKGFVDRCNADRMFVTLGFSEGSTLRLSDVVARANRFVLSVSGTVSAEVEVLPNSPVNEIMFDQFDFSPMVMGTVDPDGNVRDGIVMYWALTPKEEQ